MNLLTPLAQEGPGDRSGDLQTQTLPEPLIDAPNPVEWLGFGVGAVIFLIIILFMVRARVIAPARRRAAAQEAIFEPAGENAEITFDDEALPSHQDSDAQEDDDDDSDAVADALQPDDFRYEDEHEQKKSRSPFAGIFSQKRTSKAEPLQVGLGEPDDEDGIAEVTIETATDAEEDPRQDHAVIAHPLSDQLRNLNDDVEFRRRQAEQEEHDRLQEEAQLRAEQSRKLQEERDRAYHAAREDALRETEFERRKNEAALEQRLRSLASVERKLTEKADTLGADAQFVEKRLSETMEERFEALSHELNQRLEEAAATADQAQPSITDMADYVGRELANLRRSMQDSIDRLTTRIDESNASPQAIASLTAQVADISRRLDARTESEAPPASPPLRDLIQRFAPPDRVRFNTRLPNGQIVDCCVALTEGAAPLVIDDRYPIEACERYLRERNERGRQTPSANAYRREVLRRVVHIAENLIVPGETASSAMLFAPSDAIVSNLHANFPDLVEDSYQARVLIVSPGSLGPTLSAMAAVARQANDDYVQQSETVGAEDDAMLAEIDMLRERVTKHEDDVAGPASSLSPPETDALASAPIESEEDAGAPEDKLVPTRNDAPRTNGAGHPSMSPEEAAFERLERLEREEALAEAQRKESSTNEPKERPPFPLR